MTDKEPSLMTMKEARTYLRLSESSMRRLEREGKLFALRTDGGHRRYRKEDLDRYMGLRNLRHMGQKMIVGYCRVSTHGQKKDLLKQEEVVTLFCEKQGEPFIVFKDIGSGLNYKRPGFIKLIEMVCSDKASAVVVNYKDRLVRFGYELIEKICELHDTDLIVINQTEGTDNKKDMVDDILSIITVFSAGLYGQRSHKNKQVMDESRKLFSGGDTDEDTENSKGIFDKT